LLLRYSEATSRIGALSTSTVRLFAAAARGEKLKPLLAPQEAGMGA
jgi:hypothetical protein